MSLFLRPRKSDCAISVCDRCHMKMYLSQLSADTNSPGLRVCSKCKDGLDPYRKNPPEPEDISLRNPRPDERL